MRIRNVLAFATIALFAVGTAYSTYVFSMSKRWLHSIHYTAVATPGSHITRTDMSCQRLAIDNLDFRYKGRTRGNRTTFGAKTYIDSIVLRSTYGPQFCDTYAKVHRTEHETGFIKSLPGVSSRH